MVKIIFITQKNIDVSYYNYIKLFTDLLVLFLILLSLQDDVDDWFFFCF